MYDYRDDFNRDGVGAGYHDVRQTWQGLAMEKLCILQQIVVGLFEPVILPWEEGADLSKKYQSDIVSLQ